MIKKALLITILIILLISVRVFQYSLFYDPFLLYFKNSYLSHTELPDINWIKMTLSLILRYVINTFISLTIIYILFKNKNIIKFSLAIYGISFLVLISIYYYYISINFESGYLAAFYVRRFLIQPLFLLLLVPAFYYQSKIQDNQV